MLNWLFNSGTAGADVYVDLGTANTLIAVKNKGIVLNEPSQVMVTETNLKKRKILGIGDEGVALALNSPGNIITVKPVRDGVIADFDATRAMLSHFLSKVLKKNSLSRPAVVVSLPYGVTEVEKKAVIEACRSAGASRTYLIDEPMAAAIGAGLPIKEASGQMIIDIGGGTTEIAVIALADIVYCEPLRIGGHRFDEAVIDLGPQGRQRNAAFHLGFAASHLRAAQPTRKLDANALGPRFHGLFDRSLHAAAEAGSLGQLLGNGKPHFSARMVADKPNGIDSLIGRTCSDQHFFTR